MKLPDKQRQRIITRHRVSIEHSGYQPTALFWSGREVQEIRFQQFIDYLDAQGLPNKATSKCRVLDVGCGFADLFRYFEKQDYHFDYVGLDVSPDMIYAAKSLQPELSFYTGELVDFDFNENEFDWVFLSGALNEVVEDVTSQQGDYARLNIRKMYDMAKYGLVFNLLDARHEWTNSRPDLMSFDAEKMRVYCQTFCLDVELKTDYLPNDFTLCLTKTRFSHSELDLDEKEQQCH